MYTSSLVKKTIHTLQTLSKTAFELSNVPINQNIFNFTMNAIHFLNESIHETDYDKALKNSKIAYQQSEKSFFDSSMISQLFIPNSQKFAIYVPIFVPILVTVVVGFIKELKKKR
jgi:GPI-anchor transamidase subunit S